MSKNVPHKEYWFARDGDRWWLRYHYSPVHWKGFIALFGAIMGGIWVLIGGVLLVVLGGSSAPSLSLRIASVIGGAALLVTAVFLAVFSYRRLRERVDPVNTSRWYWRKFFKGQSEETK